MRSRENRPTNTNMHPTPSRRTPLALIARHAAPLLALLCTAPTLAQTAQPAPTDSQINVVVHDRSGNPVHALKPENFSLTINGKPLPITQVEEHTADTPVPPLKPLDLPPGTFTDYTPASPDGTLNILIFDALNTPPDALTALRRQLKQLIDQPHPPRQLAIFGLASHLILLQNLTTDPGVLQTVLEHQLIPRGADSANIAARDAQLMQAAANLQQFDVAMKSTDRQFRIQNTLDAFNTLAHALAAIPDRKNVLWVSTSFPLNITPGTQPPPSDELRQTAALLNSAQISIYPIDARSIMQSRPHTIKFDEPTDTEHNEMQQLAINTGGTAIFDATDITAAVSKAINTGADHYTLTYTPGPDTQPSLQLTLNGIDARLTSPSSPATPATPTTQPPAQSAYARAVTARGAPAPEDILFKVRVLPASTTTDPKVAPGNIQDPSYLIPGPWQRYDIEFVALAKAFTLPLGSDGKRTGRIEALVYVYDTNGRLLNSEGKAVSVTLTPDQYKQLLTSTLTFHLVVSVPVRQESYLRLAVHDVDSDRFGVVEVPASAVSRLPPPDSSRETAPAAAPR